MSYYFADEDKKIIRAELLTDDARKYAKEFVRRRLNPTQLRKYFNEVRALEAQVKAKGYPIVEPLIKMLKSKVAYGMRRSGGQQSLPENFKGFIDQSVDAIQDEKDFNAFVKHFEAVLGFFYGEGGR